VIPEWKTDAQIKKFGETDSHAANARQNKTAMIRAMRCSLRCGFFNTQ
jgi:hypothetical protein